MIKEPKSQGTMIAEEMTSDPSFAKEWDDTAFARLVAAKLINHRAEKKLSQRALAELLGVKQPFVARLESGETNPEVETLVKVSRVLGIEFVIDIAPVKRAPKLVTKKAQEQQVKKVRDGVAVVFAAV
jgi:predicted transcriptional regulator